VLAEEEALADADVLIIVVPPIFRPLSEALGVALAEAEGLAIVFPPIICESSISVPSGIMCLPFICWAVAPGASTNTTTRASDTMYVSRLIKSSALRLSYP